MTRDSVVVDGPGPRIVGDAVVTVQRPSLVAVGTAVWLSSEVMFFGALFAAAFTLRADAGGRWPAGDADVDVKLALVLTVMLIGSSVTQHAASAAFERGERRRAQRWLYGTIALGSTFVLGQAYEWSTLEFSISSHAFGSAFYTLTGFHGLHLVAGLIALGVAATRLSAADPSSGRSLAVVTLYWHFVDAVWLVVFGVLYLLP